MQLDAAQRQGKYRSRVFVGGSYHQEMRDRLSEIKDAISESGFSPVIADEVQLENEGDIHHETMVLLHSCRLAIFELSQLSGALMEIERVPDYGIEALILYVNPNNRSYLPSRMLSTFIEQHSLMVSLKDYLSPQKARQYVQEWLDEKKQKGFGS